MADFQANKLETTDINGGVEFTKDNGISADTFNNIVEGVLYADKTADETKTDVENFKNETNGTINTFKGEIEGTVDRYKQDIENMLGEVLNGSY